MADLLFITADMGGNVQPTLDIAAASSAMGHRVRVIGHEQLRREVTDHGLDFVPYTSARRWDSTKTQNSLHWVPMFNDSGIADDVRAECARRRPAVAIVDCFLFPAHRAISDLGITRVVLTHTFREFVDRTRKIRYAGASTPSYLYGYRPAQLWNSAAANLVTTVADIDPAHWRSQPANLEWTGAVLPPARPATPQQPPRVLVSLSTNGFPGQRAILQRIIGALSDLPVTATVTTGGVIDPQSLPAPDHIEVTGYADHTAIMGSCSLLIGHGGHSTTFRALAHGIPVLVIPANPMLDQAMIGVALRKAGVGDVLRRSASPATIRAGAEKLLEDSTIRLRAEEMGRRLRDDDGAARGAARIDELARMSQADPAV